MKSVNRPSRIRRVVGVILLALVLLLTADIVVVMVHKINAVVLKADYQEIFTYELILCAILLVLALDVRFNLFTRSKRTVARIVGWGLRVVVVFLTLVIAFFSGKVICGSVINTADRSDNAIVLGLALENGKPAPDLIARLDTAQTYLEEYPEAHLILTGGNADASGRTEAAVMRDILLERGVADDQMILEDQAESTKSNFRNAAQIIDPGKPVVLISSNYHKITPFFGKMPLNEIKATDVRRWQNNLTSYRDEKGEPYSPTYLKVINNQLVAIFNYAVKYYGLKENPCHKAGGMGKKKADEMLFWTKDEFSAFIKGVKDKPASYAMFMTLYYTGMREGELLALTSADIDFEKSTITINKSYQRMNGKDIVSTPKTPRSNRVITIPQGLKDCLKDYIAQCYALQADDRLFPYTKSYLSHEMERGCKLSGVKKIRIHDIRHSHASLLVEMGFSPLLIAERLGHERVQTTMETYSHLYPNKQTEVANRLDSVMT